VCSVSNAFTHRLKGPFDYVIIQSFIAYPIQEELLHEIVVDEVTESIRSFISSSKCGGNERECPFYVHGGSLCIRR
jgi:hypothetical protein